MARDIPYLNKNEIRGLFYIREINQQLEQEEAATISQLSERSDWRSSYYTSLWKALAPELVNRDSEGYNTRLSLTKHGQSAVSHYEELNFIFEEAGL